MKKIEITRRQLLRGAGGFTLGLPLLPSLLPGRALGDPLIARPQRFVAFTTDQGCALTKNMYPAASTLSSQMDLYPGHQISWGPLVRTVQGTNAVLSPILTAPASALTDRLVAKMNVLRGFGLPFDIVHGGGHHLGNFASNAGLAADSIYLFKAGAWPTIDQVMAWSPSFYKDLGSVRVRSIVGTTGQRNFGYSNPAARSGNVVDVKKTADTTLALFDLLFGGAPAPSTNKPPRQPIVDKVILGYRSLRNGNLRLSATDRQRLDDHMARLAELERALTVARKPIDCGKRPVEDSGKLSSYSSDSPDTIAHRYQLLNDVVAAAFTCGATRIATIAAEGRFESPSSVWQDWHQDVAHQFDKPDKQPLIVNSYRRMFSDVVLDLARKLDVAEAPGSTYLDNTLISWTQESSDLPHDGKQLPIVTFGSAGGFLRTGMYVDYRNQAAASHFQIYSYGENVGLSWQRWLAIQLQAMGVPRAEFERDGVQGYGNPYVGPSYRSKFVPAALASASEVPPPLRA